MNFRTSEVRREAAWRLRAQCGSVTPDPMIGQPPVTSRSDSGHQCRGLSLWHCSGGLHPAQLRAKTRSSAATIRSDPPRPHWPGPPAAASLAHTRKGSRGSAVGLWNLGVRTRNLESGKVELGKARPGGRLGRGPGWPTK
eukprot:766543-Hanusia_phi.AAC.6